MKKGARIVNVSSGGIINEPALARAVETGQIAAVALDVMKTEPPAPDNPLLGNPNVILTPHLGTSTVEAEQGLSMEVAEAVVKTLNGELSLSAINSPLVSSEVLEELSPYVKLMELIGRLGVQLSATGVQDVKIKYNSSRPTEDLDTRLLRAMVIKGLVEPVSASYVNLVNADIIATQRGMQVVEEVTNAGADRSVLSSVVLELGGCDARFASAMMPNGRIVLEGRVLGGEPYLTRVGDFSVNVLLDGTVLLCRQTDQPGMIGAVGSLLGAEDVNVSYMTVGRDQPFGQAVMAIGLDSKPSDDVLTAISAMPAISEQIFLSLS
eukprot:scaffold3383_cov412-Prasinococcus_capsulatus_cf.AAC.2